MIDMEHRKNLGNINQNKTIHNRIYADTANRSSLMERYFKKLYTTNISDSKEEEQAVENGPNSNTTTIKIQISAEATCKTKNRKASGLIVIPNELLKYAGAFEEQIHKTL